MGGTLGFACKSIFVKRAYAYGVSAETLLALRMGYSLPMFLLLAARVQRQEPVKMDARDWYQLLVLGVLGYYLASYLDFLGLKYISAGLERIVLYTYPTMVVLLSALLLGLRIRPLTGLLLATSFTGVALSVWPEMRVAGDHTLRGVLLVLACALSFAAYMMRAGEEVRRLGSTRVTALATGMACILCIAQFLILRPARDLIDQPWQVHVLGFIMAMVSTVMPVWLQTEAVRRLGASTVSMVGPLGVVFTIALAALFLHEPLSLGQFAGAVLVVGSVTALARFAKAAPGA